MSRLIASVREAEERLAGLAKALQSAWDEEVAEASAARESARRSLIKALAMHEAAVALGRQELAARVEEVVNQLRASEADASRRMEQLVAAERSFQHRLGDVDSSRLLGEAPRSNEIDISAREPEPASEGVIESEQEVVSDSDVEPEEQVEAEVQFEPLVEVEPEKQAESKAQVEVDVEPEPEPGPVAESEPVIDIEAEPEADIEVEPEEDVETQAGPPRVEVEEVEGAETEQVPEASAKSPPDSDRTPAAGLSRRIAELERVVARLPATVVEPALEELVALSRLLARGPGVVRARQAQVLLERLRKVAASRGKETTFGLSDDEFADWASLAADARSRRQKAIAGFKASRSAR